MLAGDDHGLKGPGSPPWADGDESRILVDDAFALVGLKPRVVFQHVVASMFTIVAFQLFDFHCRFFREARGGPDLAVGMWVRAAHGGTFVFEDLHVAVLDLGTD